MFQGNSSVVGRKKNQMQTAFDIWHSTKYRESSLFKTSDDLRIQQIIAEMRDQAYNYDLRRLYNLRIMLLRE